ncbi:unnamed protein product [Echinostoma caproni]|uniref:WD_REPEATS_REGION domain-containing protein n=1 Tax=Echinostoma caproni TaxID=27848 RepID=A0A183AW34_9TREM|nr:unnamed protein product [Echinostoma caproni]
MKAVHVHRIQCYDYQPSAFTCLARSSIDGLIAAGRADGAVEIYDEKREFVMIARIPHTLLKSVESLGWSEGRLFCTGALGQIHELDLHKSSIKVGNDEGFITVFSTESSLISQIQTFPQLNGKILAIAASSTPGSLHLSKSKSLIAASTDRGTLVTITYTQNSSTVHRVLLTESVSTIVWSLLFVRNLLFSGDNCGNVCIWDPRTGGLIQTFPSHVGLVLTLTVSDDSLTVFSGGTDAMVRKYVCMSSELAEPRWELGGLLRGCRRDIRGLAYLPGLSYDPETEANNSDARFEPHRLLAVGMDARLQLLSCSQAESVRVGPARAHSTLASQVGRPRDDSNTAVVAHVAALPFWPWSVVPGRSQPAQYSTDLSHLGRTWCLLHYPERLILMRLAEVESKMGSFADNDERLINPLHGPLQLAEIRPKPGTEVVCCSLTATSTPLIAYSDLARTCVLRVSCGNECRTRHGEHSGGYVVITREREQHNNNSKWKRQCIVVVKKIILGVGFRKMSEAILGRSIEEGDVYVAD